MPSLRLLEILRDPKPDAAMAFLERVRGPREAEYGIDSAELASIAMPGALRRFYEFGGRWPGSFQQNELLSPEKLRVEDDRLVFYVENQGVYTWSTSIDGDDPPVWFRESPRGGGWQADRAPLSVFLLQTLLMEYALGVGAEAHAFTEYNSISGKEVARLLRPFEPMPYGPFSWPPPANWMFMNDDAVVNVTGGAPQSYDDHWVYVSASSNEALAPILPLSASWSYGWRVPVETAETMQVQLLRGEQTIGSIDLILEADGCMRSWKPVAADVAVLIGDVLLLDSGIRVAAIEPGDLVRLDHANPIDERNAYMVVRRQVS